MIRWVEQYDSVVAIIYNAGIYNAFFIPKYNRLNL